jgi:2-methylisocitrate lyase-like PEP mutase family enzyme
MESIVSTLGSRVPLMANMVEGGKTPPLTANDLEAIGFSLVIFPGGLTRAVARTMHAYFESLLAHGSNAPFKQHMYDFAGINAVVGTDEMLAAGAAYDEKRFEP